MVLVPVFPFLGFLIVNNAIPWDRALLLLALWAIGELWPLMDWISYVDWVSSFIILNGLVDVIDMIHLIRYH